MKNSGILIDKFSKLLIKSGKKSTAERIVKNFIYLLNKKKGREAFIFFYSIICKIKPSVKVLRMASSLNKKRINIVLLSPVQQFNYSIRFFIKEASKYNYKWSIARCLLVELEKIETGTSSLLTQKYQIYKFFEKNRNVNSILF